MSPPVVSKIKSLITIKFSNNYNGDENNKVDEELRALTASQKAKSGFYLPMDNEDHNDGNESTKCNQSQ